MESLFSGADAGGPIRHLDFGGRWPAAPSEYQDIFRPGKTPQVLLISGLPGLDAPVSPFAGDLLDQLARADFPVVALVDRPLGGPGTELALSAAWRIGTPEASFQCSAQCSAPSNLPPLRLAAIRGADRVLALMLTGGVITAEAALAAGLLQRLAEPAGAAALARELAAQLTTLSASSIRLASEAVRRGANLPLVAALALETSLFVEAIQSSDAREGVRAFFAKRPPRFAPRQ